MQNPGWSTILVCVKQIVVGYLDYDSRCNLRLCSKDDNLLVQSIKFIPDSISIEETRGWGQEPAASSWLTRRDINFGKLILASREVLFRSHKVSFQTAMDTSDTSLMAPLEAVSDESINETRDSVKDPKWQKLFPSCVAGKEDARRFLVRAMFVAFSQILKHRKILDAKCFGMNYICEKVKTSSLNFTNKEAADISQTIRSAGEAISEGYLEEFALVLSEEEYDEKALEVFSFKIHYDKNGIPSAELKTGDQLLHSVARLEYAGTESVRRQLVVLVQSIQLLCVKVLKPLPEKYSANFRVAYMPETPASYRIDKFEDHSTFYKAHPDSQKVVVGSLRPNHYGALMECSSVYIDNFKQAEKLLAAHTEKVMKHWGFEVNDTMQTTFASSSGYVGNLSNAVTSSPVPKEVPSTVATDDISTELNATLVIGSPTPEKRTVQAKSPTKKKVEKETKKSTRARPYARVRSVRRPSVRAP